MGFQCVPSLFRIPNVPSFTPPGLIWRGKGSDEGFYAFNVGSTWGGNVIVRGTNLCPSLQIDGSKLSPVYTDINGFIYWEGNGYVYNTLTYGWVWCSQFPGYEPIEDYKFEDGEIVWRGDQFYSFSSIPSGPENEVEMRPRGSISESGSAKSLKAVWPRWAAKSGEFGEYEGKDGESGKKVKFSVKASGKGLTYTWYSRPDAEGEWAAVAGQTKNSLSIVASKANDGSQYYCHIQNADGEVDSVIVTLTVTPEAPTIKTQPKDAKVKIGGKAKFKVKASGKNVTYQWYYRTSADGEWILLKGATKAEYSFVATADKIGWQFRCLAKNADGQVYSKPATLRQK